MDREALGAGPSDRWGMQGREGVRVQNRLFQMEVGVGQGLPGPYGVTVGSSRGKTSTSGSRGWGQVPVDGTRRLSVCSDSA